MLYQVPRLCSSKMGLMLSESHGSVGELWKNPGELETPLLSHDHTAVQSLSRCDSSEGAGDITLEFAKMRWQVVSSV